MPRAAMMREGDLGMDDICRASVEVERFTATSPALGSGALRESGALRDCGVLREIVQVAVRPYRRAFRQPLQTHHGLWVEREGWIMRVETQDGCVGFGEIAPLPGFGSESFAAAGAFLRELVVGGAIAPPPNCLPACQFGWAMALASCQGLFPRPNAAPLAVCALLPTGVAALSAWEALWAEGRRQFKWKIGVTALATEQTVFRQLMAALPPEGRVRLDANGGLSLAGAESWLDLCAAYPSVEFVEQPLPPAAFEAMLGLSDRFPTPLALDESVATLAQLQRCHRRGWSGIWVVKPGIAGAPDALVAFCQAHRLDVVLSSVLETAIARSYIQQVLLPAMPAPQRVPGLEVEHWFTADGLDTMSPEILWNRLAL